MLAGMKATRAAAIDRRSGRPQAAPRLELEHGSERMAEDRTTGQDLKQPLERELSELRREVLESRNLVIKTDNLLKNLFAELKSVAKKNDDQYRRTQFASAAAYLAFLALALAVAVLGARASNAGERARVDAAQAAADLANKRVEDLGAQLAKAQQDAQANRAASERAIAVYKSLTEGEGEARMRGVDELGKVDRTRLNVLELRALDEKVRAVKSEIGQAAFDRGRAAHRRDDWKTAASELKRYLALDPDGADALQASYLAGTALYNLKDYPGCLPHLERFTTQGRAQKGADWAYYLLGQAHEALNHPEKAVEIYKKGVADYPGSEFVGLMQQRFRVAQQNLLRMQGIASPVAAPAPAAPVAPAPAAAPALAPRPPAAAAPAPAPAVSPAAGPRMPVVPAASPKPTPPAPAAGAPLKP